MPIPWSRLSSHTRHTTIAHCDVFYILPYHMIKLQIHPFCTSMWKLLGGTLLLNQNSDEKWNLVRSDRPQFLQKFELTNAGFNLITQWSQLRNFLSVTLSDFHSVGVWMKAMKAMTNSFQILSFPKCIFPNCVPGFREGSHPSPEGTDRKNLPVTPSWVLLEGI